MVVCCLCIDLIDLTKIVKYTIKVFELVTTIDVCVSCVPGSPLTSFAEAWSSRMAGGTVTVGTSTLH